MVLSICVLLTTGCGTFVNGIHQDLTVTSSPGGSEVSIDGVPLGTTPVVASVTRLFGHVVKVERPGYYPIEASVVPVASTWEWGNLISWGLIGFAVDAWTGGMYELSREIIHADFPSKPSASTKSVSEAPKASALEHYPTKLPVVYK
jgi:PEGA domain-containing protein